MLGKDIEEAKEAGDDGASQSRHSGSTHAAGENLESPSNLTEITFANKRGKALIV